MNDNAFVTPTRPVDDPLQGPDDDPIKGWYCGKDWYRSKLANLKTVNRVYVLSEDRRTLYRFQATWQLKQCFLPWGEPDACFVTYEKVTQPPFSDLRRVECVFVEHDEKNNRPVIHFRFPLDKIIQSVREPDGKNENETENQD
jgi:hypothetical protein